MIFYFSAPGNSQYAAGRIASAMDDHLISLRDAVRGRSYRYDVSREERIGFVFPVYYWGLPSILRFFVQKLELTGYRGQYLYVVLTCGGSTGGAGDQLAALLKEKGLTLSAQFGIPMVDNYVCMFKVADAEEIEKRLDAAEAYIDDAARAIRAKGAGDYNRSRGAAPGVMTGALYPLYAHGRSTRPFVVTDHCISCGLCQEICPCGAQAIHWKTPEEDRGRYYNPRVEA